MEKKAHTLICAAVVDEPQCFLFPWPFFRLRSTMGVVLRNSVSAEDNWLRPATSFPLVSLSVFPPPVLVYSAVLFHFSDPFVMFSNCFRVVLSYLRPSRGYSWIPGGQIQCDNQSNKSK